MHIPAAQEIYRHFKGNLYQIVTLAKHSETGEKLVIYQALYGDFTVYARPLSMFMEKVDKVKYPQETQEYRFELQDLSALPDTTLENRLGAETKGELYAAWDAGHREEEDITKSSSGNEGTGNEVTGNEDRGNAGAGDGHAGIAEDIPAGTEDAAGGRIPLDPLVIEFLDAGTYEERLNILAGLHHRITDDMINVMAMATDIEVPPGDTEQRYMELRECLTKLEKYECNRLR